MKKIFILHGWSYSKDKWTPFIKALNAHGINAKVLSIPGLTAKLNEPWTLNDYVSWLKKELINEPDKIILLGHSNGGRIAASFSARFPQKVSHLILMDSAGISRNELPLRLKRLIFKTIAKLGKPLKNIQPLRWLLYKLARESDYRDASPIMRQTMRNLIQTDLTETFSQIKASTLIVWGQKDQITPLSDGQTINLLVKNSQLEIIKNAHHSPQFNQPQQVAKLISQWLKTK